jgi:hypothetical protein
MRVTDLRGGKPTTLTLEPTAEAAPWTKGTEVRVLRLGDDVALHAGGASCRVRGASPTDRNAVAQLVDGSAPHVAWVISAAPTKIVLEVLVFRRKIALDRFEIALDDRILDELRKRYPVGSTVRDAAAWLWDACVLPGDGVSPLPMGRLVVVPARDDSDAAFRILGRGVALDVEQSDSRFLLRRVAPGGRSPPNGAMLLGAAIEFVDRTRSQAFSAEARAALEAAVSQKGSYLEIWRSYSQLEKESIERRRERIGELSYTSRTRINADSWRFQLASGDAETLMARMSSFDERVSLEASATLLELDRPKGKKRRPFSGTVERVDVAANTVELRAAASEDDDELLEAPDRGVLTLSTFGDEQKQRRREVAELAIRTGNCPMPELGLLLEGRPVSALRQSRHAPRGRGHAARLYDQLTTAQRRALDIALNTPDVALVQGPPGTGKTQFIAALQARVVQLAEEGERPPRILVTSAQHDAVDHLAGRSQVFGLPAFRSGRRWNQTTTVVNVVDAFRQERIDVLSDRLAELDVPAGLRTARQEVVSLLKSKLPAAETALVLRRLLDSVGPAVAPATVDRLLDRVRALERPIALAPDLEAHASCIAAVRALSTSETGFLDGGPRRAALAIRRLGSILTDEERGILTACADWEPESGPPLSDLLAAALPIQERLLDRLMDRSGTAAAPVPELDDESRRVACEILEELRSRSRDDAANEASVLGYWLDELEHAPEAIESAVRHYSAVLAATLQQSAARGVASALGLAHGNVPSFETVIVDEAARCHPLDLFIPMAMAQRRVVLVGDQRQLPHMLEPDVEQSMVAEQGMVAETERADVVQETLEAIRRSLFARLWERAEAQSSRDHVPRCITLDTQFRMHPILGDFMSRTFYERHGDKAIRSGRPDTDFAHSLLDFRAQSGTGGTVPAVAAFIDVPGGRGADEERGRRGRLRRAVEARRIAEEVERLVRADERVTIGVVAFYRDQVDAIFEALERASLAKKAAQGEWEIESGLRPRLSVGTVDAFQGKEFDVVFVSVTRSNSLSESEPRRKYGHLLLENRLCVAMSRQKRLLVCVGDLRFVRGAPSEALRNLIELCGGAHGLVR